MRLGKVSQRVAEEFRRRIQSLVAALASGISIDKGTATWLVSLGNQTYARLVAASLAMPRNQSWLGNSSMPA